MVREGHGDLHLRNIVLLDGKLVPFDCIEFSAALRWNDVMSEVAFLAMDLMDQGAADLAWIFVNAWLEETGDYAGLAVLRFYLVYRAMVRAKVHLMRARQRNAAPQDYERLLRAYRGYIALARRCAAVRPPALVLMHGFSGSGKSRLAAALAPALGAIRIRSDVERKRLQGLSPLAQSGSALKTRLYDAATTQATYERLATIARTAVKAGYAAIVDAAFLERSQRMLLVRTAEDLGVPVVIVETRAPYAALRRRVAARKGDASEATLAVLEHQIAAAQPIAPPELSPVIVVDTTAHDAARLAPEVAARLGEALRGPSLMQISTQPRSATGHDYRVDATQFV
jgi:predicted kinase